MSSKKKKLPFKQANLQTVIAQQEKTIQKLQRCLDKERDNQSHRKQSTKRSNSRDAKKAVSSNRILEATQRSRVTTCYQDPTSVLPSFTQNALFDTDRFTEKSSYIRRDNSTINCRSSEAEINFLKERIEMLKIDLETQERTHSRKQQDGFLKITELESMNKVKDQQIQILTKQLEAQINENRELVTEHSKQRATWQTLYNDLCEDMHYLKDEFSQFSNSMMPRKIRQPSELENQKYESYRKQLSGAKL